MRLDLNTLTVDPMLLPSGNPIICHEEVLPSQPMFPPKRFCLVFPLSGGCSEGLGAFNLKSAVNTMKNVIVDPLFLPFSTGS